MSDPAAALPSFVEGWALNSFNGVATSAPTASGIGTDGQSQLQLEYTVSGTAGGTTLTIAAGDESKGTGVWGGVIQHDDDTYGLYTIHSLAAGSCTVYPPLRADATSKTLRNLGGSVNGQHYTLPGYKALARSIYARTKGDTYRIRYAAKWTAAEGLKADWTNVGGLGVGQYSISSPGTFISSGNLQYTWAGRGRQVIQAIPTSTYTGKGLSRTFALGGATGFMEAFVSCFLPATGFAEFRVTLVVDAVEIHNQTYDSNSGLVRVVVPYTAGTSATLTVTRDDETAGAYRLVIGDVTFWEYDRTMTWTDKAIDKNGKTVVIGDSWTEFYSDGLGAELQAAITADGGSGTVVSVGLSGQTSEWGLANFDTLVTPEDPDQVVILFFTNDCDLWGEDAYNRWLYAMYSIGRKCQAIGARPIYVMPLPTASISQSTSHGVWSEKIGAGLPLV